MITDSSHGPCPTNILSDEPATEDQFEGRPHKTIADSLIQLIRSDSDGKAIAVQGGWGSGKSTVVRLLSAGLADDDTRVFTFDAWAHQGDPLRRTFLEKLIDQVSDWTISEKGKWERVKQNLSGKESKTVTRTTPLTKWFGIFLAILLLPVPFGVAIAAKGVDIQSGDVEFVREPLLIGIFLGAIPVAFTVMWAAAWIGRSSLLWVWRLKSIGGWWRLLLNDPDKLLPKFGSLKETLTPLSKETSSETTSESYQGDNPTSFEFERDFNGLLKDALGPSAKRKLLIIVDNLDRVDAKDALTIWATLQTFLGQPESGNRPDWQRRLWVVVPFDPKGIRALWAQDRVESATPTQANKPESAMDVLSSYGQIASSFLEKSFQVRVDIPPVALSNARDFLTRNLGRALPRHSDEEFRNIYRLLVTSGMKEWRHLTPRNLKMLVNDVAFLHMTWMTRYEGSEEPIPLVHISYFVMLRDSQDKQTIEDRLRQGEFNSVAARLPVSRSIADDLAALRYNVPVGQARQLLLRQPLAEALAARNGVTLRTLSEYSTDGFWEVLEDVIHDQIHGDSLTSRDLGSACVALFDSGLLLSVQGHAQRNIVQDLNTALQKIDHLDPFDTDMAVGVEAMLKLLDPSESEASDLLRLVGSSSREDPGGADEEIALESWTENVCRLLPLVRSRWPGVLAVGSIHLPIQLSVNAAEWIQISPYLVSRPDWMGNASLFTPAVQSGDIVRYLADLTSTGDLRDGSIQAIRLTAESFEKVDWQPLEHAIEVRLEAVQDDQIVNSLETSCLLEAYWQVGGITVKSDERASLVTNGFLYSRLYTAYQEHAHDAVAKCLLALLFSGASLEAAPVAEPHAREGHALVTELLRGERSEPELTEALSELIRGLDISVALIATVKTLSVGLTPFLYSIIRSIAESNDGAGVFGTDCIVANWRLFQGILIVNWPTFVSRCSNLPNFMDSVLNIEAASKEEAWSILDWAASLKGFTNDAFREKTTNTLSSASSDEFAVAMRQGTNLADLLLRTVEVLPDFKLEKHLVLALQTHVQDIALGKAKWPQDRVKWEHLLEGLESDENRDLVFAMEADVLVKSVQDISPLFFTMVADDLINEQFVKSNRSTPERLTKVYRPFVAQGRNYEGLLWMLRLATKYPNALTTGFDKDDVSSLRASIIKWSGRKSPRAKAVRNIGTITKFIRDEQPSNLVRRPPPKR